MEKSILPLPPLHSAYGSALRKMEGRKRHKKTEKGENEKMAFERRGGSGGV